MFLAIFGFFYLKEKVSLIGSSSIFLAMSGILIMVGDSISTGSLFGNLVALVIPINFAIYVMIIRKNSNLDMVPAMLYSGIFSLIYGAILSNSFEAIPKTTNIAPSPLGTASCMNLPLFCRILRVSSKFIEPTQAKAEYSPRE